MLGGGGKETSFLETKGATAVHDGFGHILLPGPKNKEGHTHDWEGPAMTGSQREVWLELCFEAFVVKSFSYKMKQQGEAGNFSSIEHLTGLFNLARCLLMDRSLAGNSWM